MKSLFSCQLSSEGLFHFVEVTLVPFSILKANKGGSSALHTSYISSVLFFRFIVLLSSPNF